jgi:hypothetical protein
MAVGYRAEAWAGPAGTGAACAGNEDDTMRVRDRWAGGHGRQNAQGMLEFGLAVPIFIMVLLVALQIAMLLTAQLVIVWTTVEVARYVATGSPERWRFPDSCQVAFRDERLGRYTLIRPANLTTFTISPSYPPPNLSSSDCNNVNNNLPPTTRIKGDAIRVTMQYNPSNLMFLPTTFFGVPIMNTLPAYTASAVME